MPSSTPYAVRVHDVGRVRESVRFPVVPAVLDALATAATAGAPDEACGLLFGAPHGPIDRFVALPNVDPQPRTGFRIDGIAFAAAEARERGAGRTLRGVFHSHPRGPDHPSARDLEGRWPETWMVIASPAGRGGWRFTAVPPDTARGRPADQNRSV